MIETLNINENHEGFIYHYKSKNHKTKMLHPHRHIELEMNLVTKGTGEYILSDQSYKLSRGSIVWLFPGQEHFLNKTDDNFETYVVVFKDNLFNNTLIGDNKYHTLSESNPEGYFCRRLSNSSTEKLEKICMALCELNPSNINSPAYYYAGQAFGFKNNSEYYHMDPVLLNAGLLCIMTMGWHLFVAEGADEPKVAINIYVSKAINLLQTFPEKDYSLNELSTECGVSASLLSRLFNEQVGLSIVDYKNKLKLNQFLDYMKSNPEFSISEACYIAGFGSYSQFYKTFRQSFGVSPKVYFSL